MHKKIWMTNDPSGTIFASTRGFSLSIVAAVVFPSTPTSSCHELFPANIHKNLKKNVLGRFILYRKVKIFRKSKLNSSLFQLRPKQLNGD